MKVIFKILNTILISAVLMSFFVVPAAADVKVNSVVGESIVATDGYNVDEYGNFFAEAKVPEGFDELIYLVFTDSYSAPQSFLLDPRNDYTYMGEAVSGLYYISGYVVNDYDFDYLVTRSEDTVVISDSNDVYITLTVTGGPEDQKDVTEESSTDAETEKVPETGAATESLQDSVPSEVDVSEEKPEMSDDGVSEDEADNETTINPLLKKVLVVVIGTAFFVGLVFLVIFIYRKLFII